MEQYEVLEVLSDEDWRLKLSPGQIRQSRQLNADLLAQIPVVVR